MPGSEPGRYRRWPLRGDPRDLLSGLLFIAVGAFAALEARNYSLGTAAKAGPGFFPFCLGLVLIGLGVLTAVISIVTHAPRIARGAVQIRPFVWIIVPVLLFATILETAGLLVSTLVVSFLTCFASRDPRVKSAAIAAPILAMIVYAAFALLLKVQIPVWPALLLQR